MNSTSGATPTPDSGQGGSGGVPNKLFIVAPSPAPARPSPASAPVAAPAAAAVHKDEAAVQGVGDFKLVFERTADAMMLLNPQAGMIVEANEAMAQLLGIAYRKALGNSPLNRFEPEAPGVRLLEAALELAEDGSQRLDWKARHATGATLDLNVVLTRLQKGAQTLVLAVAHDQTAQRRAEDEILQTNDKLEQQLREGVAALAKSEDWVRAMIEHAPGPVLLMTADSGSFIAANGESMRLFGLNEEQMPDATWAGVSPLHQPDGRLSLDAAQARLDQARAGQRVECEWMFRHGTGELVAARVRLIRMPGDDPVIVHAGIVVQQRPPTPVAAPTAAGKLAPTPAAAAAAVPIAATTPADAPPPASASRPVPAAAALTPTHAATELVPGLPPTVEPAGAATAPPIVAADPAAPPSTPPASQDEPKAIAPPAPSESKSALPEMAAAPAAPAPVAEPNVDLAPVPAAAPPATARESAPAEANPVIAAREAASSSAPPPVVLAVKAKEGEAVEAAEDAQAALAAPPPASVFAGVASEPNPDREHELNMLRASFVSLVLKEFRSPVGNIQSSAEVLAAYADRLDAAERQKHMGSIISNTKRMGLLMEDVLLLGRLDTGAITFRPQPVNLKRAAERIMRDVIGATGADRKIDLVCGSQLPDVMADETLLRHILKNLLSNALKYSEPGSPARLEIGLEGRDAVLRITDRGIGIEEQDLPLLFEAFYRGQNVGQRPGSGLGLVIVKRCVDLHGGSVQVQSALRQGTTVSVTLHHCVPESKR